MTRPEYSAPSTWAAWWRLPRSLRRLLREHHDVLVEVVTALDGPQAARHHHLLTSACITWRGAR